MANSLSLSPEQTWLSKFSLTCHTSNHNYDICKLFDDITVTSIWVSTTMHVVGWSVDEHIKQSKNLVAWLYKMGEFKCTCQHLTNHWFSHSLSQLIKYCCFNNYYIFHFKHCQHVVTWEYRFIVLYTFVYKPKLLI